LVEVKNPACEAVKREAEDDWGAAMTTLTLRYQRGHFTVSGPDVEMRKFDTRREARDWCAQNYPGSPIREYGADAAKRAAKIKKVAVRP
jgi:hypothetical protein